MIEENNRKSGWHTIIAYLIVFYVIAGFVQIGIMLAMQAMNLDTTSTNVQTIASSIMNFATYILLFGVLITIQGKNITTEFKTFKEKPNKAITLLGGFAIFYIINIVFNNLVLQAEENINMGYRLFGISNYINTTSDNQVVIEQMMEGAGAIPMFLSAVVLGPICEELVFRKAFFSVIKKPEMALVVSSLFFASIHVISSIGMYNLFELFLMTIPYLASGVALGYIYIRYENNIWVPIFVHTLSNLISMLAIMSI